jgi:hypothetical protein
MTRRKVHDQRDGDGETENTEEIADQAVKRLRAARNEQQQQGADGWREEDHAQQMMRKHANRLSAQTAH